MGILSVECFQDMSYQLAISSGCGGDIHTVKVDRNGLYIVYYLKEGKIINRTGRIINVIQNTAFPMKSYILFDISDNDIGIRERIHFCQIQNIQDITEKNAYKLAIDHGFVGSFCDWMESMRGHPGLNAYQMAVENGTFDGTEEEWFLKYGDISLVNAKKTDKVPDCIPGNLVAFTADGNLYDSGIDATNPTKVQVFIGYNSINNTVKDRIPKANDICIVKKPIDEDLLKIPSGELTEDMLVDIPMEYSCYIYDGKNWKAMNGKYDAYNIYLDRNLQTKYSIGNIVVEDNEPVMINCKGLNLIDLWNKIFMDDKKDEIVEDVNKGILTIICDIGSTISYIRTDGDGIENSKVFIAKGETNIFNVPWGNYTITRSISVDNIDQVKTVKAEITEEFTEYIAEMKIIEKGDMGND